jgi:signal transduction histidine kinase
MKTKFAAPERVPIQVVHEQSSRFSGEEAAWDVKSAIISRLPMLLLILNQQRQIVYCNQNFVTILGEERSVEEVYGMRPGELLACVHAEDDVARGGDLGGCGTTEACRSCGAVNALLKGLSGQEDTKECQILRRDGHTLHLRVAAMPVVVHGEHYSSLIVEDIGHEKRRRMLERVFFHDVLNTISGIMGFTDLLRESPPEEVDGLAGTIHRLTEKLLDEIRSQKMLLDAENGDLVCHPGRVSSMDILQDVMELSANYIMGTGKTVRIEEDADSVHFVTDEVILRRVLGSMLRHVLDITPTDGVVRLCSIGEADHVRFQVYNVDDISIISGPYETLARLFLHSTCFRKEEEHGMGGYGVRLLGKVYLGGDVNCCTFDNGGAVLEARFPLYAPRMEKIIEGMEYTTG